MENQDRRHGPEAAKALKLGAQICLEAQGVAKGALPNPGGAIKLFYLGLAIERIEHDLEGSADWATQLIDHLHRAGRDIKAHANRLLAEVGMIDEAAAAVVHAVIQGMRARELNLISGEKWSLVLHREGFTATVDPKDLEKEAPEFVTRQSTPVVDDKRLHAAIDKGRNFLSVKVVPVYRLASEPTERKVSQ